MAKIPARAHYRPATNRSERCGTCTYDDSGYCSMWKASIDEGYTCDEWTRTPQARAAVLNDHFEQVAAHVDEHLVEKLADQIAPILREVGRQAARLFQERVTEHMVAAGRPPGQAMIALYPRPEEAAAIAHPDGHLPSDMHVTLVYFNHSDVARDPGTLEEAVRVVASASEPLAGTVGGVGAFAPSDSSEGRAPSILLPNVPGLVELRQRVLAAVEQAGYQNGSAHGFNPHITQRYTPGIEVPASEVLGSPLHFDGVSLTLHDGAPRTFPLGPGALTAAGDWTPPDPGEILDVEALILSMSGKLDPIRLAVAERLMTQPLKNVGLSFDVTNPFVESVITATKVTQIANTTRADLMRIVRASYREGLTVPDTARAIRAGMAEASVSRSIMIARTELVGAVNGGSLATMKIVDAALGGPEGGGGYTKTWMTAPGAEYPRHEDYDDLDGQTVGLDEPFDVGGVELEFPGDPGGPPEEVINCRCTMRYSDGTEA